MKTKNRKKALKQDMLIRDAELAYDQKKYNELIERCGGREHLLSLQTDDVQTARTVEHTGVQS